MYGPSTRNQRIESWWYLFRRSRCHFWINIFKDLCDANILDTSLSHLTECLRFCFIGLLQSELDETVSLWNNHRIRKVRNSECPAGRPNVLYYAPNAENAEVFNFPEDLIAAEVYSEELPLMGCSQTLFDLISIFTRDINIHERKRSSNAEDNS